MNGPGQVNNRTQVQVPLDQNETVYINQTKPNVYNISLATLQTATALAVDKFLGGTPNQSLRVRAIGSVTLNFNAGGTGSIITNTGANKTLDADKIYEFLYVDGLWLEQADSSGGSGGGTTDFPVTFNDSNAGGASPQVFDGGTAITVSANTLGAVSLGGSYNDPSWITGLAWSKISGKPTTIGGYGITDFVSLGNAEWVQLDGAYIDPSWITSLPYSKITGTPSLAGYVVGPASATNNAIVRYDNTTGKLVKNSNITVSDLASSNVTVATSTGNSLTVQGGQNLIFAKRSSLSYRFTGLNAGDLRIEFDASAYAEITHTTSGQIGFDVVGGIPARLFSFRKPLFILNTTESVSSLSVESTLAPQIKFAYDGTNYLDISAGATGIITFAAAGSAPGIALSNLAGVGTRMVTADATGNLATAAIPAGGGDVIGPASATDNAVARFDLATGKLIQNSSVLVSDLGVMTINADGDPALSITNTRTSTATSPTTKSVYIDSNFSAHTDGPSFASIYIEPSALAGGFSFTTMCGIYIGAQTGADENYAIFAQGTSYFQTLTTGSGQFVSLVGTGTRMVVADLNGLLSTQTIPDVPATYAPGASVTIPTGGFRIHAKSFELTSTQRLTINGNGRLQVI